MMKKLLVVMTLVFGLIGESAFAEEIVGLEAEKIMGNGDILSVERASYTEYKILVRYKKKIYHCHSEKVYRQDSADGLYQHCTYQIYKDDK